MLESVCFAESLLCRLSFVFGSFCILVFIVWTLILTDWLLLFVCDFGLFHSYHPQCFLTVCYVVVCLFV